MWRCCLASDMSSLQKENKRKMFGLQFDYSIQSAIQERVYHSQGSERASEVDLWHCQTRSGTRTMSVSYDKQKTQWSAQGFMGKLQSLSIYGFNLGR